VRQRTIALLATRLVPLGGPIGQPDVSLITSQRDQLTAAAYNHPTTDRGLR
jgi:hypothetical protein